MRIQFVEPFEDKFKKLSQEVKDSFYKQIGFLANNLRHPSLRAKKFDEEKDIWQARVDGHYRFYFQIRGDTYFILNIRRHKD